MDTSTAVAVLELDHGFDAEALELAYVEAVRRHRPERDPEGFMQVRAAYELLVQVSRSSDSVSRHPRARPRPASHATEQDEGDPLESQKAVLRQASESGGFTKFRRCWDEIVPLLSSHRELCELGLFGATLTFFSSEPKWNAEVLRLVNSDGTRLSTSDERELQLLDLYKGYREHRTVFCNTNPVRQALDQAIVAWGDPQARVAPTGIAQWLRVIESQPHALLDAFARIGGSFQVLPLVEFICRAAPDCTYRSPRSSAQRGRALVADFVRAWQRTMTSVRTGERTSEAAERHVRELSISLLVEERLSLSTLDSCLEQLNDSESVFTGSLRRQLQDDYVIRFLDLAARYPSSNAVPVPSQDNSGE